MELKNPLQALQPWFIGLKGKKRLKLFLYSIRNCCTQPHGHPSIIRLCSFTRVIVIQVIMQLLPQLEERSTPQTPTAENLSSSSSRAGCDYPPEKRRRKNSSAAGGGGESPRPPHHLPPPPDQSPLQRHYDSQVSYCTQPYSYSVIIITFLNIS